MRSDLAPWIPFDTGKLPQPQHNHSTNTITTTIAVTFTPVIPSYLHLQQAAFSFEICFWLSSYPPNFQIYQDIFLLL